MVKRICIWMAAGMILAAGLAGCGGKEEVRCDLPGHETPEALIEKYYSAYQQQDKERFVECFYPDDAHQETAADLYDAYLTAESFYDDVAAEYGTGGWEVYAQGVDPNTTAIELLDVPAARVGLIEDFGELYIKSKARDAAYYYMGKPWMTESKPSPVDMGQEIAEDDKEEEKVPEGKVMRMFRQESCWYFLMYPDSDLEAAQDAVEFIDSYYKAAQEVLARDDVPPAEELDAAVQKRMEERILEALDLEAEQTEGG